MDRWFLPWWIRNRWQHHTCHTRTHTERKTWFISVASWVQSLFTANIHNENDENTKKEKKQRTFNANDNITINVLRIATQPFNYYAIICVLSMWLPVNIINKKRTSRHSHIATTSANFQLRLTNTIFFFLLIFILNLFCRTSKIETKEMTANNKFVYETMPLICELYGIASVGWFDSKFALSSFEKFTVLYIKCWFTWSDGNHFTQPKLHCNELWLSRNKMPNRMEPNSPVEWAQICIIIGILFFPLATLVAVRLFSIWAFSFN